jgi:hypothetical protein
MNWNAIGAIGELVGAVAVVVTLAYLAFQVRQNTTAMTTAMYESAMRGFNEVIAFHNSDQATSSLMRRGWADPGSLNDDESFRFNMLVRYMANHLYKLFRLYEVGAFPADEWERNAREGAQIFSMPGGLEFRTKNLYYEELWSELARYEGADFSDYSLGTTKQ